MNQVLRMAGELAWRLAASFGGFYAASFAGQGLQRFRGQPFGMPVSWGLSLAWSFYSFSLLAIMLAGWATLDERGRRWPVVTGTILVYTAATFAWCGAWAGAVDRPYRFLFILGCGVVGLVAPWAAQALARSVAHGWAQMRSATLSI
jgi:hypothetical protein